IRTTDQGPGSSPNRSSSVTITRVPATAAKSRAIARRMACPSAAHDAGRGRPARPPPVTHSWIKTVVVTPSRTGAGGVSLRIIPVLDLKGGLAVHAIGGNRDHYRPLRTPLHADSQPLGVARGFRDVLHFRELYLADLDAIAGDTPD